MTTVTDLFCGAGGSSIGAEAAGATLRMAANHWSLAIETHAANFPHADHDCADVSQVDPRRYPRTNILLASPECTHHSLARSTRHRPNLFDPEGDPQAERSRATMWDVPRFAERHHYEVVIVENVVEVTKWAPFHSWLQAMDSLGYQHRVLSLNSMVAWPTPQSRDRVYIVFWRDREPDLEIRPCAWCPRCESVVEARQVFKRPDRIAGKYRQQYLYRCATCLEIAWPLAYPAAAAIDWALPAPRIGDRKRPLAPATLRRIQTGLDRFGAAIIQKSGHTYEANGYARVWPTHGPMPTQTTEVHHALVVPVHHGQGGPAATPAAWPWPTQTGRQELAIAIPMRNNARGHAVHDEPIPTITASNGGGGQTLVTVPHAFIVKNYSERHRNDQMAKPITEPLGSITTVDHHSLVETHSLDIDDCGFRMLEPHEIGRAMAFKDAYKVKGNKRERVRQYGNAVTPPVMQLLVERAIGALSD